MQDNLSKAVIDRFKVTVMTKKKTTSSNDEAVAEGIKDVLNFIGYNKLQAELDTVRTERDKLAQEFHDAFRELCFSEGRIETLTEDLGVMKSLARRAFN